MRFTDWCMLGLKRNKEVNVKKIQEETVDMGGMAVGSLTVAAEKLARMIDQGQALTKVLMVQDGEYLPQVTEYALRMAQRLDFEIIALDVTDKPLQYNGDRRTRESDRFMEMARVNAARFTRQAKACGVKVKHIMNISNPEESIAQVSGADAGIRYVLSKPDENAIKADPKRAHVPVFDLHCSRL